MAGNSLRELYIEELRDLHDAENQLIKALPKMAKAAESDELRSGIEEHLQQTKEHAKRIEQIFDALGEGSRVKKCKGMQGIVSEGSGMLKEDWEGAVADSAIISAARRVEHYEIAAYTTVHEWSGILGENEAASLTSQTLDEEKETDRKLAKLAQEINQEAAEASEASEEEEEEEAAPKHRAKSAGG
jgi:ferritin-like metal-binding protein YciE